MTDRTYTACLDRIEARLREPAPGRIQLLTGPRQVGKTTLLLEIAERRGEGAVYAACDGPEAAGAGFWERLWSGVSEQATRRPVVVLLDEVQHLEGWADRLKAEWDRLRRRKSSVHVVASGSSALRLGSGSRERLAGRFEPVVLTHWSAASLADVFGMSPDEAAVEYVMRGSYPGARAYLDDQPRWRSYVRESIVEPAIGRDLLALGAVRRPALLRQLFAVCCGSPAQIVSLQKMQGSLQDRGALETISHYLRLLAEAYLVVGLPKHSRRAVRARASPPKLVVLSSALLAGMHPDGPPDQQTDPARFGAWVENACLAFLHNAGHTVSYWRREPSEVDAVVDGPAGRWAIEVKTGRYGPRDIAGLLEFTRDEPSYRPLVLCDDAHGGLAERAGITWLPWRRFLVEGLP